MDGGIWMDRKQGQGIMLINILIKFNNDQIESLQVRGSHAQKSNNKRVIIPEQVHLTGCLSN